MFGFFFPFGSKIFRYRDHLSFWKLGECGLMMFKKSNIRLSKGSRDGAVVRALASLVRFPDSASYTLSYIRILFFRPRLNILIFLPTLD